MTETIKDDWLNQGLHRWWAGRRVHVGRWTRVHNGLERMEPPTPFRPIECPTLGIMEHSAHLFERQIIESMAVPKDTILGLSTAQIGGASSAFSFEDLAFTFDSLGKNKDVPKTLFMHPYTASTVMRGIGRIVT